MSDCVHLLALPDALLLVIMARLPPQALSMLSRGSRELLRLAGEEVLWAVHCRAVGLPEGAKGHSRARYVRFVKTCCYECRASPAHRLQHSVPAVPC